MYGSDFAGRGDNSALQESVSSIIPRAEQAMRSIPGIGSQIPAWHNHMAFLSFTGAYIGNAF